MNKILLTSALLSFSGCVTTPIIQRPFSKPKEVSVSNTDVLNSITIDEVNSGNDTKHRSRAKELGISYVDYLHMVNNNKIIAPQSEPVLYHKITK